MIRGTNKCQHEHEVYDIPETGRNNVLDIAQTKTVRAEKNTIDIRELLKCHYTEPIRETKPKIQTIRSHKPISSISVDEPRRVHAI